MTNHHLVSFDTADGLEVLCPECGYVARLCRQATGFYRYTLVTSGDGTTHEITVDDPAMAGRWTPVTQEES